MGAIGLVVGLLLVLTTVFVGLIWTFQERIAFQPPRPPYPDAGSTTRVDYTASDGQRLFAYLVGDTKAGGGLLLCFHGNADLAVWQVDWAAEIYRRTGVTVMLVEYRGYMGISGKPSYAASGLDAEAAYLFARRELAFPENQIAFFGHSLGTAIAVELALRHRPAALLLQSPFTSARAMARTIGWRPVDWAWGAISRLHYNTVANVARINAPVSVSHGHHDRLVPFQMGEDVYEAAKVRGGLLIVPDATHNDVGLRGGQSYWQWMSDALRPVKLPVPDASH